MMEETVATTLEERENLKERAKQMEQLNEYVESVMKQYGIETGFS